jgi:formate dehydrogenase accessory protein FdhE
MNTGKWDARIRRAVELASTYSFAAEVLRLYECITLFQQSLYLDFKAKCGAEIEVRVLGSLRQELDLFILLPRFGSFLSLMKETAPGPLSQSAEQLSAEGVNRWQEVLSDFWQGGSDSSTDLTDPDRLISWAFLQPYAEYLADHTEHSSLNGTPHQCPLCFGKPQVGVLRQEGDGAKRSLICSLCSNEWEYRRIVCPSCGEENVEKLAVYVAEKFPHIRVEACDTCRHYIKTIDLTKNGNAIPVVDELAAIPLSLWAQKNDYIKVSTNLMGI